MPRKKRAKADLPVTIADTLEALKEEIPGLKKAVDLPTQLPDPRLDAEPEPREVIQPDPNTALPRDSGHRNDTEHGSHAAAVLARRPAFAPVPEGFKNVVRHEGAGIRVNKSIDYKTAAIQFAEDRPLSRATEYDLMSMIQDAGFGYKPASRQWERPLPEGMAQGENIIDATRLAKEIADARSVERGR
jgi:hypothetical protein